MFFEKFVTRRRGGSFFLCDVIGERPLLKHKVFNGFDDLTSNLFGYLPNATLSQCKQSRVKLNTMRRDFLLDEKFPHKNMEGDEVKK